MEDRRVLRGVISCRYLVSVNGRLTKQKRLTQNARREMADLHASLIAQGFTRDDLPKAPFYAVKCGFYLRHSWFQRDTDNMIKIVLDVLASYFDINDNRMVSNQIYRRGLTGGPDINELVYFAIEPVHKKKSELIVKYEDLPWNKILNSKS